MVYILLGRVLTPHSLYLARKKFFRLCVLAGRHHHKKGMRASMFLSYPLMFQAIVRFSQGGFGAHGP
jgi:hypothetical protein